MSRPAVERDIPPVDTTVTVPRWSMAGKRFGPPQSIVVRVHLVDGSRFRYERTDGEDMGDLTVIARPQLAEAEAQLLRQYNERLKDVIKSITQRVSKTPLPAAVPPPAEAAAPAARQSDDLMPSDCTGCERKGDGRTTTAIFRCDRGQITDRISRLRSKPAAEQVAEPAAQHDEDDWPEAVSQHTATPLSTPVRDPREEQRKALAEMAALRERRWKENRSHPSDLDLTPAPAPAADGTRPPDKMGSSVFRVDREVITDRISRLRVNGDERQDPGATGSTRTVRPTKPEAPRP